MQSGINTQTKKQPTNVSQKQFIFKYKGFLDFNPKLVLFLCAFSGLFSKYSDGQFLDIVPQYEKFTY